MSDGTWLQQISDSAEHAAAGFKAMAETAAVVAAPGGGRSHLRLGNDMDHAGDKISVTKHRFYPSGLGEKPICGACGGAKESPAHVGWLADAENADVTMCPICGSIVNLELTVRMLRVVDLDGTEHRNTRVCQSCTHALTAASQDPWARAALLFERGKITQKEYLARVEQLAQGNSPG